LERLARLRDRAAVVMDLAEPKMDRGPVRVDRLGTTEQTERRVRVASPELRAREPQEEFDVVRRAFEEPVPFMDRGGIVARVAVRRRDPAARLDIVGV